jgi:hypothetical protein
MVSLLFQSPMAKKMQLFFFVWVLGIMTSFALTGIMISKHNMALAGTFFVLAILMTGIGFMIRKRVLRAMGEIPPKQG